MSIGKPKALLFCLLFIAWMVPGLLKRDPWKADEAYTFGLVLNMAQTGDYVVPTLGSDPFMEKPPIFFITSALLAKTFSPPLALHEAARLACVLYALLTFAAVFLAARELHSGARGQASAGEFGAPDTAVPWMAVLLLMGSVGLIPTAHMLITDNALVAGYSIGLYGILLGIRRSFIGGLICGTGAGLALLSKGLLGPGALGVTVLCLPLFKSWRTSAWWQFIGGIFLAVIPWLVIWPLALYHRSPQLFKEWFWDNNLGRFLGESSVAGNKPSPRSFYFTRLLVFGLPCWPLAMLGVWKTWAEGRGAKSGAPYPSTNIFITALAAVLFLLLISSSWQKRSLYATSMLMPLALLGAVGLRRLPARAARLVSILVAAIFSIAAVVQWFCWLIQFTPWSSLVVTRVRPMIPDFVPDFQSSAFIVAALATFAWLVMIAWRRREDSKPADAQSPAQSWSLALLWTSGAALVSLLAMTLWLPVANGNMSYSKSFVGLSEALGPNPGVIGCRGLGEPQRAMIHYYAGIKPLREETHGELDCRWMLIQGKDHERERPQPPGPNWRLVWVGRHHLELFHLYHLDQGRFAPLPT